jgi:hypothetical protein
MSASRKASLTSASTIQWSSGTAFNGFALIMLSVPKGAGGIRFPSVSFNNAYPSKIVGKEIVVPIKEGVLNNQVKVWYNADLTPPGCRYVVYYYDQNWSRVAPTGPASLFDVTADPFTLTIPSLTVPTTTTSIPAPEDIVANYYSPPLRETPVGTIDGVNTTFTLSVAPTTIQLYLDGQLQRAVTDYTQSSTTLTFVTAPPSGSVMEAFLWTT